MNRNQTLNQSAREQIFASVVRTVTDKFHDPALNGIDWPRVAEEHRSRIVSAESPEDFEARVNDLVRELRVSHAGFFSEHRPRAAAKLAIGATLHGGPANWVVQDVHPGGPAHGIGLEPGDVLLAVAGKDVAPPELPAFALGESIALDVERRNGYRERLYLHIPVSKQKNRPVIHLDPPIAMRKPGGIGYLRIALFPGMVGIDVARQIDDGLAELSCDRLVIDLRGNSGGGMGCLRVMSSLTPDRLPVGYSVTRKDLARPDFNKERLPRFDRIPDRKIGLVPLILRFALRGRSVAVFSEAKGPQRFHGHVVLLLNEHTASSAEMIAAFAAENKLATIVGTRTAGRLLGGSSFKVGHGYRLAIPVVGYRTWRDTRLEGVGIEPDIAVPFDPEAAKAGSDTQLAAAVAAVEDSLRYRTAIG